MCVKTVTLLWALSKFWLLCAWGCECCEGWDCGNEGSAVGVFNLGLWFWSVGEFVCENEFLTAVDVSWCKIQIKQKNRNERMYLNGISLLMLVLNEWMACKLFFVWDYQIVCGPGLMMCSKVCEFAPFGVCEWCTDSAVVWGCCHRKSWVSCMWTCMRIGMLFVSVCVCVRAKRKQKKAENVCKLKSI